MLSLYYVVLYIEIHDYSQRHSVTIFESLRYDLTAQLVTSNYEVEEILKKPYLEDISYQLIFTLPSGQTYIHTQTLPDEKELISISFPAATVENKSPYQLDNRVLRATIDLENGYQLYVVLRHKMHDINWTSYRYWLPLLVAFILFMIALTYMLRRQANWQQLLLYTDNLSEEAKEAYSSMPFIIKRTTSEFLRLGYSLSRIKYQLHNDHRRIQLLKHRLERLVDSAPLPMLMTTRQGQISFFNKRFEQVFATSYQRDLSYALSDFLTGSDKATQQLLLDLSAQRVTRTLLVHGLENKQPYQLHITPWFGEHGQVRGFTALLNNVNHFIQQSETLKLKNQSLETQVKSFIELRSIIGHELRTPLNAIISTLDLIEKETLNSEQQEILSTLTQSSQSMLTMLNDMLDMAKIEAGRVDIVSESTDIFELGQHISDLMIGHTRRQDIDLLYYFAPDCPRYISTDGSRLCQILLNLMDNAVKFTSTGYVALTIEGVTQQQLTTIDKGGAIGNNKASMLLNNKAASKSQNQSLSKESSALNSTETIINSAMANTRANTDTDTGTNTGTNTGTGTEISCYYQWIRFTVKDSGIGIATTEQQKLFSYFNQANPQINKKFGGTGLGLAISSSFAQLLGGFIHLDSKANCGSTFSIYIPCSAPIYQPVYHFHSSLPHIHLIAVVDQALRETYLQRVAHYLSMNISIYSELNSTTITQLEQQLTLENPDLTTILMLDYECFEAYNAKSLAEQASRETVNTTDMDKNTQAKTTRLDSIHSATSSLKDMIDNCDLPKILLSRKPERGIPSTILDEFDGFLNKPINVTVMVSELVRLAHYQPAVTELTTIAKDSEERDDANSKSEDLNSNKLSENKPIDKQITELDLTAPLILIVEDNVVNQKIGCKLLAKLGYRSIVAENGQQALSLLETHRQDISLILMDCRMPVMDGLEATKAIRDSGNNIAIIALTANDSTEDRIDCQRAGMDEFLTKPIQKERLKQVLEQYVGHKK